MTGPEHYRHAENYLAEAAGLTGERARELRELALVHATLAHAAATAMVGATAMVSAGIGDDKGGMRTLASDRQAWRTVASASGDG
ncbi:hypothetical protein B0I33_11318 [Prauserella shujinwangii]|uniref:Uncharacterized protein n=1 Tax=Prauserella shujinwangii TaxID=1453103 RepID=A0A2T0LLD5_9PSEU|nr:hypothetical protein [Prauserella shujinwangii]PRX43855.1 hypothetical protein B0I33_11318 [Prauserella shujinwangii]